MGTESRGREMWGLVKEQCGASHAAETWPTRMRKCVCMLEAACGRAPRATVHQDSCSHAPVTL